MNFLSVRCQWDFLKKIARLFKADSACATSKVNGFIQSAQGVKSVTGMVDLPTVSDTQHVLLGDRAVLHERISRMKKHLSPARPQYLPEERGDKSTV